MERSKVYADTYLDVLKNKTSNRAGKKRIGMWSLGDEMVSPTEFRIEQKLSKKTAGADLKNNAVK